MRDEGDKKRIEEYDVLRVIATICVVIGHSCYLIMGGVHYEVPKNSSWVYDSNLFQLIRFLSGWVYGFHMPLFFLLSGMVFHLKREGGFWELVKEKARRLLLPYYLCGYLFMLPVKRLSGYYSAEDFPQALMKFWHGGGDGHLWFLMALFWCFVVFWIIRRAVGSKRWPLVLGLALLVQILAGKGSGDLFLFRRGMGYLFWFALGYYFDGFRKRLPEYRMLQAGVIEFLILLEVVILDIRYSFLSGPAVILVSSYMMYVLSILIAKRFPGISRRKWFQLLAHYSMYIYLFHDPLEYVVLKIAFGHNWLLYRTGCLLYMGMRTAGVIGLSILLGMAVERMKKGWKGLLLPAGR